MSIARRPRPLLLPALLVALAGLLASPRPAAALTWRTGGMREPAAFASALARLDNNDIRIAAWASTAAGEWIVVGADKSVDHSAGFPATLVTAAQLNLVFGRAIEGIDCASSGACILVHSQGCVTVGNVPAALTNRIQQWHNNRWAVRDVELTDAGWLLLGPRDTAAYANLDPDLAAAIADRLISKRYLLDVAIGFDGRWLLYADTHPMHEGLDSTTREWVGYGAQAGVGFERVLLGPGNAFALYDGDDAAPPAVAPGDPVAAVEHALAGGDNLWARMATASLPGLAIAIIKDGQLLSARGYGTRTAGQQEPVLGRTPFDVASLSKFVGGMTTLSALRGAGATQLLKRDLTTTQLPTITAWLARGAANPKQQGFALLATPAMPSFTLEQSLSHAASLTLGGSPAFAAAYATSTNTATVDLLSGRVCDEDGCAWSGGSAVWNNPTVGAGGAQSFPGAQFAYTSDGYLVAQAVVEDVTGKAASQLAQELVFDKLGLVDTTAVYPFAPAFEARVANHHRAGVAQPRAYYPWTFAGGVWSSARDYAEMMLVSINGGTGSNGVEVLTAQDAVDQRTARVYQAPNGFGGTVPSVIGYGLGVGFDGLAGSLESNAVTFFHSGRHPDRSTTYMCGSPSARAGIVILMNSDGPGLTTLRNDILDAFTQAMGWAGEDCR